MLNWIREGFGHRYMMAEGEGGGEGASGDGGAEGGEGTGGEGATATEAPPAAEINPLDWRTSLAPELQNDPTIQQYNSMNDAAKALVETKKLVGSSIRLPGENDPDDVRAEKLDNIWKQLGRPDTKADYKVPEDIEYPEGFQPFTEDSLIMESFRQGAYERGITQDQFDWIMQVNAQQWREVVNQAEADKASAGVTGMNELKGMHGSATPEVMQRAQHLVELMGAGAFGGPEVGGKAWEAIQAAGLHNNPAFVTSLANLATRMQEGPYHRGDETFGTRSEADIDKQISELREKSQKGALSPDEDRLMNDLYNAKVRFNQARQQQPVRV